MSPAFLVLLGIGIATQPLTLKSNPQQPGTVRVAVVNVGHVFNNWDKARAFKNELEASAAPFNARAKAIQEDIAGWEAALRSKSFRATSKEEYEKMIKAGKRELEDLAADMRAQLGKKSENNLVALWKEFQAGVREYSTKNGIDLVLGYGDPLDKSLMDLFPNVNRKMSAMDSGSVVPLFITSRVEIGEGVTELLNKRYREQKDSPKTPGNVLPEPPPTPLGKDAAADKTAPAHLLRTRSFALPINASKDVRAAAAEFRLYVKSPATDWKLQQASPPDVTSFRCNVADDGEYWYKLAMVDKEGRTTSADVVRVVVDTRSQPPGEAVASLPGKGEIRHQVKSISDYSSAIQLTPKDATAYMGRAAAWYKIGKFDQAIDDLNAVTKLEPKNADAFMARGMVRYKQGELAAAIAEIDGALRLDPRCPDAHRTRGRFWHAKGDLPRAIADFDTALRLHTADHDIYFLRGRAYGEQGNYAKAVADFTNYVQHRPKEARGYGMRALAYLALGDSTRGWADAAKARELSDAEQKATP